MFSGYIPGNTCVAAPTVPVTASVTGLPCPLPAAFVWNGAQTTLSQFIADVKAQVNGAVYNAALCKFTAPEGSVFPPLAVSAVIVTPPPIVYCPSRRLPNGGFGFDAADSKDPAATEVLNACAGDTFYRPIYIYPTARLGATTPVVCDTGLIGYAVNKSDCAPACPCPDMNVTVNNAAPVNNVNVSPAVNNFAPTTNVAAPNVTLPAPTVASQTFDSQNRLVTTMTDGTIYTSTLATC